MADNPFQSMEAPPKAGSPPAEESSAAPSPRTIAWQPFTPRGVSAFAGASNSRLLLVQFIIALVAGIVVLWFVGANYSPVITRAASQFPETAKIERGELTGVESAVLAEGKFLSLVVRLPEQPGPGHTADVQVEFGRTLIKISSLLGYTTAIYPRNTTVLLGRSALEPWWGAWQPMVVAAVAALFVLKLLACWSLLGLLYIWPAKLVAYFADRDLTLSAAWRLACAAQMTGAVFMTLVIFLYGIQALDLIRFAILFALHMVIGWIYVLVSPVFLPQSRHAGKDNPFLV